MNRISEEVLKRMHPSHDAPVHVIKLPVGVVWYRDWETRKN